MRSKHIQIITIAATLLIGACSANGAQETLVAENATLGTEIAELRTTATFQADELQQTVEYIETIVPRANRLRDELSSTLQASGIDVTRAPVEPNPDFVLATAPPSAQQQAAGTIPELVGQNTPLAPTDGSSSTATAGQPTLFNLVTAEGVGSNDCALSPVTMFTADTPKIYVVATAVNIMSGTTLGAQWYMGDTALVKQEFAPKDNINDNCIWFYAEPVDFPFTPGSYRVELLINGTTVSGAQASFSIQAAAQSSGG